jgi:hypothetical protein
MEESLVRRAFRQRPDRAVHASSEVPICTGVRMVQEGALVARWCRACGEGVRL